MYMYTQLHSLSTQNVCTENHPNSIAKILWGCTKGWWTYTAFFLLSCCTCRFALFNKIFKDPSTVHILVCVAKTLKPQILIVCHLTLTSDPRLTPFLICCSSHSLSWSLSSFSDPIEIKCTDLVEDTCTCTSFLKIKNRIHKYFNFW